MAFTELEATGLIEELLVDQRHLRRTG